MVKPWGLCHKYIIHSAIWTLCTRVSFPHVLHAWDRHFAYPPAFAYKEPFRNHKRRISPLFLDSEVTYNPQHEGSRKQSFIGHSSLIVVLFLFSLQWEWRYTYVVILRFIALSSSLLHQRPAVESSYILPAVRTGLPYWSLMLLWGSLGFK